MNQLYQYLLTTMAALGGGKIVLGWFGFRASGVI